MRNFQPLFFIFVLIFSSSLLAAPLQQVQNIQYSLDNILWRPLTNKGLEDNQGVKHLWIQHTITLDELNKIMTPALYLTNILGNIEVYQDNNIIYRMGKTAPHSNSNIGQLFSIVKIQKNLIPENKKIITIKYHIYHSLGPFKKNLSGRMGIDKIFLGDHLDIINLHHSSKLSSFFTSLTLFLLGIVHLILWPRKKSDKSYLYLGIFSIFMSIQSFAYAYGRYFCVTNIDMLNYVTLSTLWLSLYSVQFFNRLLLHKNCQKGFTISIWVIFFSILLTLVIPLFTQLSMGEMTFIMGIIGPLAMAYVLLSIFYSIYKKSVEAKIMFIGYFISILATILTASAIFAKNETLATAIDYGLFDLSYLARVLCLVFILRYRFVLVQKKLAESLEAIAHKNKELHEWQNTLEHKVLERTKEIRSTLKNIHQGILTFGINKKIQEEYSTFLEYILQENNLKGLNIIDTIFQKTNLSSKEIHKIVYAIDNLIEKDITTFNTLKPYFPKEIKYIDKKILEVDWSPLPKNESETIIDRIMLSLRDVTDFRKTQEELFAFQQKELEKNKKEKERMEQELKMAQTVQNALIPPSFVKVQNIDIASYYIQSTECGGDWWSYQYLEEQNSIIFSIADVTGHGVGATLVTAIAKGCILTINDFIKKQQTKDISPEEILRLYNTVIYESTHGTLYMTAFVGILNLTTNNLVYSNASHNWPAVIKKSGEQNGEAFYLTTPGNPVGIKKSLFFERDSIQLNSGDILALYTDGLIECTNKNEIMLGRRRLMKLLDKYKSPDVLETLNNTIKDCYTFYDNVPIADDLTLILIKRD